MFCIICYVLYVMYYVIVCDIVLFYVMLHYTKTKPS